MEERQIEAYLRGASEEILKARVLLEEAYNLMPENDDRRAWVLEVHGQLKTPGMWLSNIRRAK
jgi:hypothetical protein